MLSALSTLSLFLQKAGLSAFLSLTVLKVHRLINQSKDELRTWLSELDVYHII